jgi:putative ABC transport system permease protein
VIRLREWIARLWGTLRPGRPDRDLDEELRLHMELAAEDARRRADSPDLAMRDAAIHAGGMTQAIEALRDQRGLPWLSDLSRDVRYAIRSLRRSPGFTMVAILTLALGIGATTTIYSVVDTILLQPLRFADSDRLVRVVENVPSLIAGRPARQRGVTYQDFLEWRARTRTLSDTVAVASLGSRMVRTSEGTARLWGGMITANAFTLLGARAMLGRTLGPGDDANPHVVVLGFDTWRRLFHSEQGIVGTTIELQAPETMFAGGSLDRRLLTVVGVLPAGFEVSTGPMDFYTPFVLDSKRSPSVSLIGRLRSGVPLKDAIDEANAIGGAIRPPRPASAPAMTVPRFDVQILKDQMVQGLRPALRVLLAAVAVVLLIVCANVANLLLARGTARRGEMAVRFAIGASRGRVVRQVLTECLVLAIAGGAIGTVFAAAGVTLVKQLASVEAPGIFRFAFSASILPRVHEIGIEVRMFGIAFGIAAMTSLLFGVLPALHLSRTPRLPAMGSRGGGSGRGESRIRAALVVGQLVMATVLLVGAGLLIHSFVKLSTVDKGYDPSNVLAFQLVLPADYPITRKTDTIEAVLARLRATPNVEAAGFTRAGILIPEEIHVGTFVPQGRTLDEMRADAMKPLLRPVSYGYLTAMGVPLLDGREFEAADAAASMPAIVISRTVARRYFGDGSAVGQFVNWHVGKGSVFPVQVVGVVGDVRNESPDREANPDIFIDYRQLLTLSGRWGASTQGQDEMAIGFLSFAIRTRGEPASAVPAVGRIVRSVDPTAGIDAMIPMDRLVSSSVARPRFYAVMLGVFAGVAGVLAAIGIYGVLAYAVMQRTQEIGVRMALGAQPAQVLALVLGKGVILTTIGIGLGLVGAAVATRSLQGMLFGITPLDPKTFIAVSLMFGLVATFASFVPARRATKVDPMVALRNDG